MNTPDRTEENPDGFDDLREILYLKGVIAMEKLLMQRLGYPTADKEEILRWRAFLISERKRRGE